MLRSAAFASGHELRLLQGGGQYFPALISAVDVAQHEVRLETYIFHFDVQGIQVAEALERAALRGVAVYMVMDGVGTPDVPLDWQLRWNASGVRWQQYAPLGYLGLFIPGRWRRMHRKLCVVDGESAFCGGINLIYQFWIHTEAIGRMPQWFEAVMNTPSHHRVHHATNPRYLDANYAGVFIIWDKMFGSFTPETDEEKIRYGIVKQLGTFNLLYSVFHEWIGIAKDVWSAPWRHKLGYIWRPPGWSHDGSRDTSDSIKARWRARQENQATPAE